MEIKELLKNKKCEICGEYKNKCVKCHCGKIVCLNCSALHVCVDCIMREETERVLNTYPNKNGLKWI